MRSSKRSSGLGKSHKTSRRNEVRCANVVSRLSSKGDCGYEKDTDCRTYLSGRKNTGFGCNSALDFGETHLADCRRRAIRPRALRAGLNHSFHSCSISHGNDLDRPSTRRPPRDAARPLTLELAILAEEKSAKIIALLEQYRRNDPNQSNHRDEVAEEMSKPTDPHAVLDAIRAAHEDRAIDGID